MKYLNDTGLSYLWGKISSGLSGKADKATIIADSGTTYTIATAADNTEYRLGTLTSLTLTAFPAGNFECLIVFTAGTGISVSLPASALWVGGTEPTFNTGSIYEISIKNGRVVVGDF